MLLDKLRSIMLEIKCFFRNKKTWWSKSINSYRFGLLRKRRPIHGFHSFQTKAFRGQTSTIPRWTLATTWTFHRRKSLAVPVIRYRPKDPRPPLMYRYVLPKKLPRAYLRKAHQLMVAIVSFPAVTEKCTSEVHILEFGGWQKKMIQ